MVKQKTTQAKKTTKARKTASKTAKKKAAAKKSTAVPTHVTKRQVIKALEKEFLIAGFFVFNDQMTTVGTCGVCAVGAVLRSRGLENDRIYKLTSWWQNGCSIAQESAAEPEKIPELLEKGDYMSALSTKFEDMLKNNPEKHFVEELNPHGQIVYRRVFESSIADLGYSEVVRTFLVPTPAQRKRLVAWVEKNFPNRVPLFAPKSKETT